jgi:hypoxanthine phosphoribosyltransferase
MSEEELIIDDRADLDVLISQEDLESRIAELGEQIGEDYGDEPIHVIAVLKGSFMFLADLVRAIPSDRVSVDFLGLSSYGDSTKSSGVVRMTQDLSSPIEGRNVLIVEDIIDTGLTMKYLIENLTTRRPKSLEICTLLDKPDNSVVEVDYRYVGFTIPNEFVIGYGLDYAERFRNVPFIGVVRQ